MDKVFDYVLGDWEVLVMKELWQLIKTERGKDTIYMVDTRKKVLARLKALKTSCRTSARANDKHVRARFRVELAPSETDKFNKKPCGYWNECSMPRKV